MEEQHNNGSMVDRRKSDVHQSHQIVKQQTGGRNKLVAIGDQLKELRSST